MNYCSNCGSSNISFKIPLGDSHPRHVCDDCNAIFYSNPKLVVGSIPVFENKLLLCKRAIEPRFGFWTLPAGYMENGETITEGAIRETKEEANAEIQNLKLYTIFNIPRISQIYVLFNADLKNLNYKPGEETSDVQLFTESNIPWNLIAFSSIKVTIEKYYKDSITGKFPSYIGTIN